MVSEAVLNAAPENELIRNTMKKADLLLNSYKNPVCSVSGGSDSDVMLDLIERAGSLFQHWAHHHSPLQRAFL